MKKMSTTLVLVALLAHMALGGDWSARAGGQFTIFESTNAPFPHPDRMSGHTYGDTPFDFETHYSDSSIALFIPKGFKPGRRVDLVFYFHGWGNNIHKSLEKFRLLEQFSASQRNAIFVFPQGPRNAKDSFGGRLEDPGTFKRLVEETLHKLKEDGKIRRPRPGRIVLTGHSGAYHVIAAILNRGGLTSHIEEVVLFDALYGQLEKYAYWLDRHQGRLVNVVTPNGGTLDDSMELLDDLRDWGIPFKALETDLPAREQLLEPQVITIFTQLGHSEVIDPFFKLALESSSLDQIP